MDEKPPKQNDVKVGVRVNKYLADKKIATRREADALIASGKIFVNGARAVLGQKILSSDKVEVRQKKNEQKKYRYFLYNKPRGIVTTNPEQGEKDILRTSKFPTKVFPIGRLDKDSSGLIIMTNDGRITDALLSPKYEHEKEYIVSVDKTLRKDFKEKMERGVKVPETAQGRDGYFTKPCRVSVHGEKSFNIILTEGKNRQIRRMCEALGYKVTELKRIRIGKFMLDHLKPGEWREIKGIQ